jgi:outer membrane lipoprotein-sorting protein
MNNKNIKSAFVLFFIAFVGFSQSDQRARQLLNQVSEVYAGFETMSMTFAYQLDNANEGISQKEEGTILVDNDKYKLTIMGIQQLFDGTSIYTIDDLNEEVIVQDESSLDNPLNPLDIFEFPKEGYLLQWDIAQRVSGRDIRYVKLIPTQAESQSKYLLLGIGTAQTQVIGIWIGFQLGLE